MKKNCISNVIINHLVAWIEQVLLLLPIHHFLRTLICQRQFRNSFGLYLDVRLITSGAEVDENGSADFAYNVFLRF